MHRLDHPAGSTIRLMATARPGQESGKTAETQDQIVHRWRDLRNMLAGQLDMFEAGVLTLRSNDVNVSEAAISDLKRSIVEFDALISGSR